MQKIPIGQAIAFGYGFLLSNPGTVARLTWLPLLFAGLVTYLGMAAYFDGSIAYEQTENVASLARGGFVLLVAIALSLFFYAMIAVALTREALGLRAGKPMATFAIGRDEWNMFRAYGRYMLALVAVGIVSGIGGGLVAGILTVVLGFGEGDARAAYVVAGFAVLILLPIAYYGARMWLLLPSVVLLENAGVRRAYDLLKGNFWRAFAVLIVLTLPVIVLQLIVAELIQGGAPPGTPESTADTVRVLQDEKSRLVPALFAQTAIYVVALAPIYAGAAYIYRFLVPGAGARTAREALP